MYNLKDIVANGYSYAKGYYILGWLLAIGDIAAFSIDETFCGKTLILPTVGFLGLALMHTYAMGRITMESRERTRKNSLDEKVCQKSFLRKGVGD